MIENEFRRKVAIATALKNEFYNIMLKFLKSRWHFDEKFRQELLYEFFAKFAENIIKKNIDIDEIIYRDLCLEVEKFIYLQFLFTVDALIEPIRFISKLGDATQTSDHVSYYIKGNFSREMYRSINGYKDEIDLYKDFLENFVAELNCLLKKTLYKKDIFAGIQLSEETLAFLNCSNEELIMLNRRLLEDVYPEEIEKIPFHKKKRKLISSSSFDFLKIFKNSQYQDCKNEYLCLDFLVMKFLEFRFCNIEKQEQKSSKELQRQKLIECKRQINFMLFYYGKESYSFISQIIEINNSQFYNYLGDIREDTKKNETTEQGLISFLKETGKEIGIQESSIEKFIENRFKR